MAITFQVRGSQLNAYYARFAAYCGFAGTGTDPAVTASATSGHFGSYIAMADASVMRGLLYPGYMNLPTGQAFSILTRIIPRFTGVPTASQVLFVAGGISTNYINSIELDWMITTGALRLRVTNSAQVATIFTTTATFSGTSGTAVDLGVAWDGTTSANALKFYANGSLLEQQTPGTALPTARIGARQSIGIGQGNASAVSNYDLVECAVWDSVENLADASIASRTAYISTTAGEGFPAVSVVETGTTYYYMDQSRTGTYDGSNRWTALAEADVRVTIPYKSNSTSNNKTGLLNVPAEGDVESGVSYDNGTKTGTLDVSLSAASLATALLDNNDVESSISLREAMKLILSAVAGKVSGAPGTVITIRNTADTKDRIVATVDANGNRTAITYDVT